MIFGTASSPGGRVAGLEFQWFARPDGIGRRGRRQFRLRRQLGRFDLPPERRNLNGLQAELDVRQTKAAADDPAIAEQLLDPVRMGRRSNVEVFRLAVQQQVAHAAANQVGDVIVLVEPIEHLQRVRVDVTP